jgi:hypothetical protein
MQGDCKGSNDEDPCRKGKVQEMRWKSPEACKEEVNYFLAFSFHLFFSFVLDIYNQTATYINQ